MWEKRKGQRLRCISDINNGLQPIQEAIDQLRLHATQDGAPDREDIAEDARQGYAQVVEATRRLKAMLERDGDELDGRLEWAVRPGGPLQSPQEHAAEALVALEGRCRNEDERIGKLGAVLEAAYRAGRRAERSGQ